MRIPRSRTGLVLAGGAALGAYEVGVAQYLAREVAHEVGPELRLDIMSGTSAGAINASVLAALADMPTERTEILGQMWSALRLGQVLRPSAVEVLAMLLDAGGSRRWAARLRAQGGVLDWRPIARMISRHAPIHRVHEHLRAGRLSALALSATHIASGRAVVFYESADPVGPWPTDPVVRPAPVRLRTPHALASAAIPLLFPPVLIDGEAYCDGGLRQMVPLSPAIHLGARRLLVVSPLSSGGRALASQVHPLVVASPSYLLGKALNALLVDRLDPDLARVNQINHILEAGRRRFGPAFAAELNEELLRMGSHAVEPVHTFRIEPSVDIAALAAEAAASPSFARRERGIAVRVLRRLADDERRRAGDLLSYLMFDGGFAAQLIELGRQDARAHHDELCAFLTGGQLARQPPAGTGLRATRTEQGDLRTTASATLPRIARRNPRLP